MKYLTNIINRTRVFKDIDIPFRWQIYDYCLNLPNKKAKL